MKSNELSNDFLLTEYTQLRKEIFLCIQQIASIERNALILSGAIWAWLATHPWNPAFIIIIFTPSMITKLFEYKRESISDAVAEISQYIYKIEEKFNNLSEKPQQSFGWEHREKVSVFKGWSKKYWKSLFWGNITIAILYALSETVNFFLR